MDYTIATGTTAIGSGSAPPATGTPGEFTDGDPSTNTPATVLPAYQMNAIVEEIISVIKGAGLTLDRTNTAQLLAALQILFPPYSGVKQVAPAIANATVINTSGATTKATVTFTAPANGWVIGFATTHLAAAGNSTGYQFSLLINGTTINQDTNPNTNTEYGFLAVTANESCTVTGQVYLSNGVLSANANIQTLALFIPNP